MRDLFGELIDGVRIVSHQSALGEITLLQLIQVEELQELPTRHEAWRFRSLVERVGQLKTSELSLVHIFINVVYIMSCRARIFQINNVVLVQVLDVAPITFVEEVDHRVGDFDPVLRITFGVCLCLIAAEAVAGWFDF